MYAQHDSQQRFIESEEDDIYFAVLIWSALLRFGVEILTRYKSNPVCYKVRKILRNSIKVWSEINIRCGVVE